MPTDIPPDDLKRFVQLLRGYLAKTGRKQRELADASHVTESLLSKVLKGKAAPNLTGFCDFQAPFLVAHGGITQARQVREMAALLGRELDETRLNRIAKDVEELKIPELDSFFLRDVAEAFRQTIPAALNPTETGPTAATVSTEPAESVASDDSGAEPGPDALEGQLAESPDDTLAAALAAWRGVLSDMVKSALADRLDPDEVNARVLEWESQQLGLKLAGVVWEWLGSPETLEKLRQRERLDFVLQAYDGQKTWNRLEWEWLNHALAETARRQAGQSQLSPSQLLAFATDIGQVAFEAIQADTEQGARLAINLTHRPSRWPSGQPTDWHWLNHVAQSGPLRLSVSADGLCRFESREEAEFLAAQYLLNASSDQVLVQIARNGGRPFGVLWQAVRSLHFAGRDENAAKLIQELRHVSEDAPLNDADAAHLLAACESPASPVLKLIWRAVEEALGLWWWHMPQAPEYRAYIAHACRDPERTYFRQLVQRTAGAEWETGRIRDSTLRSLAILGGSDTIETLMMLTEKPVPAGAPRNPQEWPLNSLEAVLAVVPDLPAGEQITLLESLALSELGRDDQWRAVSALADVGTIPAIRALERIASRAADLKLGRYAETQSELLDSPAHLALVARELDATDMDRDLTVVVPRVMAATSLLVRSVNVMPPVAPSRVLSRSLARLWVHPSLSDEIRVQAAIGLRAAKAWPALEICLEALPLADQPASRLAGGLLPPLASPAASPLLWQLLDRAASPAQRVILIGCIGQARGMALDQHFEQLLAGPSEPVAVAAMAALVESLGPAAADRLAQIAVSDPRPDVLTAANEGLAEIGSERALPYLREKLSDPDRHGQACLQLTHLHHPDAEVLLVEAAKAVEDEPMGSRIYWPALAMSGGAIAVQALREFLGPEPDDLTLGNLRAQLPPETVTQAPAVWGRLAADPSPAWRKTTVAILVRDPSQALIDKVVHIALADTDWAVRSLARHHLQVDVPMIGSPAVAELVLDELDQQLTDLGYTTGFMLDLTRKCLRGLSADQHRLPPDLARQALAPLRRLLVRAHPIVDYFYSLLAAVAFPEFAEAAGDIERLLHTLTDPVAERHLLETLIAIQAPSLPKLVTRLARSDRRPALQQQASDYLVEASDINHLAPAPNDLTHVICRIAIRKGIRFLRSGFRHKVVLPNGGFSAEPHNP